MALRNNTPSDTATAAAQVEASATSPATDRREPPPQFLIPTGSTLLNLACSDTPWGGYGAGRLTNIVGDESTGKTVLAMSMFMAANTDGKLDGHRFIYDDAEAANAFDVEYLFGPAVAARIESPAETAEGEPAASDTIQDFKHNVTAALDEGPCIYVLDSFDSLTSDEELAKIEEEAAARAKGVVVKGSYGAERAKANSQLMRTICGRLAENDSALVIISQTRDVLNAGTFGKKKYRAGGRALDFYSSHIIWLSIDKIIKRTVKGLPYPIGVHTKAAVSKNKLTGKKRMAGFPIFYDYGVDDITSCIDYLMTLKHWPSTAKGISAPDLDFVGSVGGLVSHVEDNGQDRKLARVCAGEWADIEQLLRLERKPRYG